MRLDYPTLKEQATPEYVLEVIRDNHRQACQYDLGVMDLPELGFETAVADWIEANDYSDWREIAYDLNEEWGLDQSYSDWEPVLDPELDKSLREVCEFIAAHAFRTRIQPARVLGTTCATAGAFLTVRSLLHASGVDVRAVRPSTTLAGFVRSNPVVFLDPISKLAPGSMPLLHRTRLSNLTARSIAPLFLLGIASGIAGVVWLTIIACLMAYAAFFGLRFARFEFKELETFGDLALVLAESA